MRAAGSYEIQSSVDPVTNSSWVLKEVSNISSLLVNSFTSGTKMWLRVAPSAATTIAALGATTRPKPCRKQNTLPQRAMRHRRKESLCSLRLLCVGGRARLERDRHFLA